MYESRVNFDATLTAFTRTVESMSQSDTSTVEPPPSSYLNEERRWNIHPAMLTCSSAPLLLLLELSHGHCSQNYVW